MVPIGPLFTRFKRVVRDITRANGKTVRLIISGEKTELDKRMIDELGDPLIHMVRNSADHGVESPEERVAAGSPRPVRRGKLRYLDLIVGVLRQRFSARRSCTVVLP